MNSHAEAFAPGNISLLFKVMPDPDPAKMGSLGSGFTVNEGTTVTVSVRRAPQTTVTFNGKPIELPTMDEVVNAMTKERLTITISSPLPLGSGFGISGASALSAAHAINALLHLHKEPLELAKIAHRAEVVHKTGLGDVGNQWKGGCCVKFVTSSLFQMKRLPFAGMTVYARSWGKIPTPSILANTKLLRAIDLVADNVLSQLQHSMREPGFSFAELLDIANNFTKKSGLISLAPHTQEVIRTIKKSGHHAAMIILGDAVVSDIYFEGATKLTIVERGVTVLE